MGRKWTRFGAVISSVAVVIMATLAFASADPSLAPAAIPQSSARVFVGLTPTRVLDTRVPIGVSTKAPLGAGATLVLPVVGTASVWPDLPSKPASSMNAARPPPRA